MKIKLAFIWLLLTMWSAFSCQKHVVSKDYTQFVNPLIGTEQNGHCFPGASIPFGMIQAGPETGNFNWAYCGGYQNRDTTIYGFAQTHINGTGVHDLGDILIQPFTGSLNRENYHSRYNKNSEKASAGYYSVVLTDFGVRAEMTATAHTALHCYSYPSQGSSRVLIDFQSALIKSEKLYEEHVLIAAVNFDSKTSISGYTQTKAWVERTYYYVIEFSKPIVKKTLLPKKDEREKAPRYVLDFDLKPGEKLLVKIAMSASSVDGAKKNLKIEIPDWNFEKVCNNAKAEWNIYLSRVVIEGTQEEKINFYTSMYHLLLQPNNIADINEKPFYSTLSLWDTYRAAHPLYTILAPDRVDGFVNSMLHQFDQQGFLPIWALWGKENYCMIGNHAVPVIIDAYLKGFRGFDAEKAYQAVKSSLTKNHLNSDWGIYEKYGYYPFDRIKVESISRTLESAYDDYCAAQFAKALNKTADYEYFAKRSNFYKNVFDRTCNLMRGKNSFGNWRKPFNPLGLSNSYSLGGDYTEGNAWQYTWSVQHDVPGLIELMGGKDKFADKLDSFFVINSNEKAIEVDVTGLIGQYAHGNEPSHHVAYMFGYIDRPWRTQELVHQICKEQYKNKPDGLCGNDDCGQMSAWYIFSTLGFYPVNPCGGEYVLGAPQIKRAQIHLPEGKIFTVETENFSAANIYVQSVELNGVKYEKNLITHQDIMKGGLLRFFMGNLPKK